MLVKQQCGSVPGKLIHMYEADSLHALNPLRCAYMSVSVFFVSYQPVLYILTTLMAAALFSCLLYLHSCFQKYVLLITNAIKDAEK